MSTTTTIARQDASCTYDGIIKAEPLNSIQGYKYPGDISAMDANRPRKYKARRLSNAEDPDASQVQIAYCMPGPTDHFTIRYIDTAAFQDSSYWLCSPVSQMLGYPLKVCIANLNDYLQPAGKIPDPEEPLCRVADRLMTVCDVRDENFGKLHGDTAVDRLRGTALIVCEDGDKPDLRFLECMNAYVKKQLVSIGNEIERLEKRRDKIELRRYREAMKAGFEMGAMRKEWEDWKRKEEEARAKFEADRLVAEEEAVEAADFEEDE